MTKIGNPQTLPKIEPAGSEGAGAPPGNIRYESRHACPLLKLGGHMERNKSTLELAGSWLERTSTDRTAWLPATMDGVSTRLDSYTIGAAVAHMFVIIISFLFCCSAWSRCMENLIFLAFPCRARCFADLAASAASAWACCGQLGTKMLSGTQIRSEA